VVATEGPAGKEECFSQAPVCEMISESDSHEGHLGLRRIQKTTRGDEVWWGSADMERSRTDEAVESGLTACTGGASRSRNPGILRKINPVGVT
jgi:hypothetical protein